MRDDQPYVLRHIVARWRDAGNITHRKKFSEHNMTTQSARHDFAASVYSVKTNNRPPTAMNYCHQCGAPVEFRIPPGDSLPRHVCPRCETIHYINPKVVVGCIAEWQGKILLCRRAIEPRQGCWTLPAGFMENSESTVEAAQRETFEEACAQVKIDGLFSLINIPHISQVHLFYRGRMLDADFGAGVESLETALFAENEIPWAEIAFHSVTLSLKAYLADRRSGQFGFHEDLLTPPDDY